MAGNFVVNFLDDHSWLNDKIDNQCPFAKSTFIDNGVNFTGFRCSMALCGPARACAMSGKKPHNTYVIDNDFAGAGNKWDDTETLFVEMEEAGYRVIVIGKLNNNWGKCEDLARCTTRPPGITYGSLFEDPAYLGFRLLEFAVGGGSTPTIADYSCPGPNCTNPGGYSTVVLKNKAVAAIQATPPETPILLWFAPHAPHQPWTVEQQYQSDPWVGPDPSTWGCAGSPPNPPCSMPPSYNQAEPDKPQFIRDAPIYNSGNSVSLTTYRQVMQSVDDAWEAIWNAMVAAGRTAGAHSTCALWVSDNSHVFGDHRMDKKSIPQDAAAKTPFRVYWPGNHGSVPRTETTPIGHHDIAATITDIAGVTISYDHDGDSAKPHFQGTATDPLRSDTDWENLKFISANGVPRYQAFMTAPPASETFWEYHDLSAADPGKIEFYKLSGDPWQVDNRNGEAGDSVRQAQLYARLEQVRGVRHLRPFMETEHPGTHGDSGSTTIVVPYAAAAAAGRHVIWWLFASGAQNVTVTATDTKANVIQVDHPANLQGFAIYLLSTKLTTAVTTSDSATFRFSASVTDRRAFGYTYKGLKATGWFRGVSTILTGSGRIITCNPVQVSENGLVMAGFSYAAGGGTASAGSGYDMRDNYTSSNRKCAVEDVVAFPEDTYTPTLVLPSSVAHVGLAASYDMEPAEQEGGGEGADPPTTRRTGTASEETGRTRTLVAA